MPENPDPRRADWSAIYYHRADADGHRVRPHARGQRRRRPVPLAAARAAGTTRRTCPENLLLWFHRLPWDHRLQSGRTLWDELVRHYSRGAAQARLDAASWEALRGKVDDERHRAVLAKLRRQAADAAAWRDKCLRYFQTFSQRPLPATIGPAPPTGQ